MYIQEVSGGYRNGEQVTGRGLFLILVQTKSRVISSPGNFRAVVRKVALRQLGHWMMGKARIGKEWYSLSGSYGHDGLPLTVKDDAFDRAVPVPEELYDAWSKGGGWNSCGSEAAGMRKWALEHLDELTGPNARRPKVAKP
jgi:hypothetical protein